MMGGDTLTSVFLGTSLEEGAFRLATTKDLHPKKTWASWQTEHERTSRPTNSLNACKTNGKQGHVNDAALALLAGSGRKKNPPQGHDHVGGLCRCRRLCGTCGRPLHDPMARRFPCSNFSHRYMQGVLRHPRNIPRSVAWIPSQGPQAPCRKLNRIS